MTSKPRRSLWRALAFIAAGLVLVFILLSVFAKTGSNPPVLAEPKWDSPQTRELAKRACFDCHSNETVWPWYSQVFPASLLVAKDVDEGRQKLNFSEWGQTRAGRGGSKMVEEITEVIRDGKMPMPIYLPLHPQANLTQAEKQQLINGLATSLR